MERNIVRPIAPAPSSTLNSVIPAGRLQPEGTIIKSGIKRASTACQSCKQIKRKCDQRQPCSNCQKIGADCIYDQTQDGRRRAARKRNVEELELKRDALDTILEALRQSDDQHVQHLLGLIRSNAPLEDIIQYATTHENHFPEEQLASLAVAVDTGLSRKAVMSISALCDSPPIKVPAKPWTTITADDNLVSHLVSAYFTWYHHTYPTLVEERFIADMQGGNLDCTFCSPLLVNAVLAAACQFTDHPLTCQTVGDSSTRGQHFLTEAQRLWMEQAARPTLVNLQGGLIMCIVLTLVGKDRMSMPMIDQLSEMAEETTYRMYQNDLGRIPDYQKSLQFALWAVYMGCVGFGLAFMRPKSYATPSIDRPTSHDSVRRIVKEWHPYPNREPVIQLRCGNIYDLQYDLHQLGAKVIDFLFAKEVKEGDRVQALRQLEQEIDSAGQMLPSARSQTSEDSPINPSIMDIHLFYHFIRIMLYNTLKNRGSEFVSEEFVIYARKQCLFSARVTGGLYSRYFRDFGPKALTMWMPQTAVSAAYMLIDDLDVPEVQEVFHEVCLVLTSVARRWYVMRGHARMLFITADTRHVMIPEKTRTLLRMVAQDQWGAEDHKNFDTSLYPNYALATGENRRGATMGNLLQQWASLDIEQGSPFADDSASVPNIGGLIPTVADSSSYSVSSSSKGKEVDYSMFDPALTQQEYSADGVDQDAWLNNHGFQ